MKNMEIRTHAKTIDVQRAARLIYGTFNLQLYCLHDIYFVSFWDDPQPNSYINFVIWLIF